MPRVNGAGPHPGSWGAAAIPPGALFPSALRASATSNGSASNQTPDWCDGLWPPGGQQSYAYDCYGHDEPGVDFYSNLPGSGGNFTWTVTLPVDRSPTLNQSDLYVAIWFGMPLTDPFAWMDQCFLELQFYPDSSWYAPGPQSSNWTVYGQWVGEAVAWQIEASNGYEDPCYISPLYTNGTHGPGFFNMTQGDTITVTMTGWVGSPYGENISIDDTTTGNRSFVNLYNFTGSYANIYNRFNNYTLGAPNYPLDPAYVTSSFENGLQWTPGGQYPVSFAFETGHAGNPSFPSNNSYGGCSGGVPPSTAYDPAVPCPSYDPGSWANDTLSPWKIGVPTFFNGQTSERPAQVAFTQDFGGFAAVDPLSNYACAGAEGSAWCSYPWYSYSCAATAFEFGATDYPGVSEDFGKYNQFAPLSTANAAGWGFYPPTNVSLPACGGPAYTVGVGISGATAGGSVYFLSSDLTQTTSVPDVVPGTYSIHALGTPTDRFVDWTTTGGVSVDLSAGAWATITVTAAGSVTAHFAAQAPTTRVSFDDSPSTGAIVLLPQFLYSDNGAPLATLASGQSYDLPSGIYALQSYPPVGYNFTGWSVSGPGAYISAPFFPSTLLVVTGAAATVTVTADYASAPNVTTTVQLGIYFGNGTATLAGHAANQSSGYAAFSLSVGTYGIRATPDPGYVFVGWYYGGSLVLSDSNATANVTLENGTYAILVAAFEIAFNVSASAGGSVSLDYATPIVSGSSLAFAGGQLSLIAVPLPGFNFTGWSVSDAAALWVMTPTESVTVLQVNASGNVTATFVPATTYEVRLFTSGGGGQGLIVFNLQAYSNNSAAPGIAPGVYTVSGVAPSGYFYAGYTEAGSLSGAIGGVRVSGNGSVTALFLPLYVPVTFVGEPYSSVAGKVYGVPVTTDQTVYVHADSAYPLNASLLAPNTTFVGWVSTPGIRVAAPAAAHTSFLPLAPGTVYALTVPYAVRGPYAAPFAVDVNHTVLTLNVTLAGSANVSYFWDGLPPGCVSNDSPILACTPTTTGFYNVTVSVNDSYGDSLTTPSVEVVVVALPTLSGPAAQPAAFDLGVSTTLSWDGVGGVSPYTFSLTAPAAAGCPSVSGGATTALCTPTATGSYSANVTGTDAQGASFEGGVRFTVNPLPTVMLFGIAPAEVTVGIPATLAVTASGGTGTLSYAYANLPTGCASADNATLTCRPSVSGSFLVTVTVTDADRRSANASLTLLVNPRPLVSSFTATPASVTKGQETAFAAVASGGTSFLSYSYAGLPAGCTSLNLSILRCFPNATGSFAVTVTVTDAFGVAARSNTTLFVTAPATGPALGGALTYVIVGVVLLVAAVALVAVLVLRRRRAAHPPPVTPWEGEAPPSAEPTPGEGGPPGGS